MILFMSFGQILQQFALLNSTNKYNQQMAHFNRKLLPQNPITQRRDHSFQRASPFRNNQLRLKQIYEASVVYRDARKESSKGRSYFPLTSRRNNQVQGQIETKYKSYLQNLNAINESKGFNRYRQNEKLHQQGRVSYFQQSNENSRAKEKQMTNIKIKDEQNQGETFKIRNRRSISGSLKKKNNNNVSHHVSSVNPPVPIELNYYEQGKKLYRQGKFGEALKLFQIAIQKDQSNGEYYYYAAVSSLSKHQYEKALNLLTQLVEKFPNFPKKSIYLFGAIASKNVDKIGRGIIFCNEGLTKYNNYIDLYFYRAKLYECQQNYEKAHEDYEIVISLKKDHIEAYYNNALCLKKLQLISNSLSCLNSALYADQKGQWKYKILLQRFKIYFQNSNLKEAKKDLAKLFQLGSQSSEIYYYRGLLLLQEGQKKDSILSFQKAIRIGDSKERARDSIIQITKTKIEDRDFYSAYYNINRSDFLMIDGIEIQKFKLFTEGVVFMMKRKIDEGVKKLEILAQKYTLGQYFQKMYYIYLAFGHFMQNKHAQAIQNYKTAQKFGQKDKYILYNQTIAEGIVLVQNKNYEEALNHFSLAQNIISANNLNLKIEPFIYRALTYIQKTRSRVLCGKGNDELQTLEQIFVALKQLDKAYDVNDGNSNMLYLRSLIYMFLGKNDEALQDIIKAISKSQQNVAKYFFFRGLAHETLGNKKQALNDFNICINLDEKYVQAYFERAKLLFSNDQASKGLDDIKKMKQISPDLDTKIHECALFYTIRQFELAESCLFQIVDEYKRNNMKILINLKQLRITEAKQLMLSNSDKMICDIILGNYQVEERQAKDLTYFNRMDYFCYLGIKYYHLNNYEESLNNFSLALKQKNLMDLEETVNNGEQQEGNNEENEQDQGQIDFESKKNQLHYLNYNLFLLYLAMKQRKRAYQIFVRDLLPSKQYFLKSETVGTFSRLLFQTMKIKKEQQELLLNQKPLFQIEMFRSIYSQSVDFILIDLPNFTLKTKFCYLIPNDIAIQKQYLPKINNEFILKSLEIRQVQNRPEPPWVKRNNQDLVFTDQVIDINVEFQTTEHDEEQQEEYEGEEGEEEEESEQEQQDQDNQESQQQSRREEIFDPRKFRQQMRLGDDIQRKLERIMQKGRKNVD